MKNLLARKWDTVKHRPVTDRPRGLIVTKRQILQAASLAGAAPGFLELRKPSPGARPSERELGESLLPLQGRGVVQELWPCFLKSEMWALVGSLHSRGTLVPGFQCSVARVLVLGGVTLLIGGGNVD